jgi:hypothetical protein
MLQEKYLPVFHFSEKHRIKISQTPEKIFPLANKLDFSRSRVIRFLFALRGLPATMMNKEGLSRGRFIELECIDNSEIIIGLIGQFWKPTGKLQKFEAHEFLSFQRPGFLKACWNFQLIPQSETLTILETETRIQCLDKNALKKFSWYWFFIRPFSGMIRLQILKSIKRSAESIQTNL